MVLGCSDDSDDGEDIQPITLKISPAQVNGDAGSDFDLDIMIENVEDLFSISFELAFDSQVVEVQETAATQGGFWGNNSIFYAQGETDRVSVGVTLTQTQGEDGVSGNGTIAKIHLTGLSANSSTLTLENIQLVDENAQNVEGFDKLEVVNGAFN